MQTFCLHRFFVYLCPKTNKPIFPDTQTAKYQNKPIMKNLLTLLLMGAASLASAQNPNPIRVNQVGYYPHAEKTAVIESDGWAKKYVIKDVVTGKKVWKGKAVRTATSPWSGKERAIIDFSDITKQGTYILTNGKDSEPIVIKEHVFSDLAKASLKAFYLQRSGEVISKEYAGQWSRPSGHPDTLVYVHPSAASASRPAGTVISSPGGWYDAGDYNKYIVNSGYSVGLMLCAYEMNEKYFKNLDVNIPESRNNIPDILDEIMVNIKWMQTMQDPEDGGVYHKLTTPNFEGFIMPKECKQPRYVVQKTTAAALDFAATMAKASRIYGEFAQYKDFAEEARKQARLAFDWALAHPAVYYRQNEMNAKYEPKVNTGAYDDMNVNDEFLWAATEIIITELVNRNMSVEQYYNVAMEKMNDVRYGLPTWGNVASLAIYSFIGAMEKYGSQMGEPQVYGFIKEQVLQYADAALATIPTSCYNNPGGNNPRDFFWGCNSESFAGQGIMMLYAYRLTGDKKYLTAALENADYLLGRNATGYCYVTGFGTFSPKAPHHRLSHADKVIEPLPGFLVGGSNPGQQDKRDIQGTYHSNQPDESYLDETGSYASNEIAINWNASLAALICWIEAEE